MELKFLGRGAAFNPKEGNTSAYFIEKNELFLIDCGENIFGRLYESGLLNSIESINIMITHTHSDHIGSIGSLAMYSFYVLHKPLNIILPKEAKHLINIENVLSGFYVEKQMYNYINEKEFDNNYETFQNIRYIETNHRDDYNCYGILFKTKNGIVYFSGDTKEINNIKALIDSKQKIDKLYIDTTTDNFPGNVHVYIGVLVEEIPDELKKRVYCMHINNDDCIQQIKDSGFNVVEVEKNDSFIKKTIKK